MRALLLAVVVVGSGCVTIAPVRRVEAPRLREVPAQTEVKEYEIAGQTPEELRAQLDKAGPVDASGARHDAYTHWFVKWNYPFARSPAGCATGPVTITLTVSMDLPRWVNSDSGPDALKARWQEYLDSLVTHESGHRENAVQAGAEIERALPQLAPQATCEEMDRVANEEGQKVLARFREADVAYDGKTDHGATQGARFP
jgi:predicted secreted Zn-dependent protease